MKGTKQEKLIVKFLCNQASVMELDELEKWIQEPKNEEFFNTYVKINYAATYTMKNFDKDKIKNNLFKVIKSEQKSKNQKQSRQFFYYAAAILLPIMILSGYFFRNEIFNSNQFNKVEVVNEINIGTDRAVLTLEDGSEVSLEKGTNFQTNYANSNGEQIVYNPNKNDTKEIVYNYLTIPRGGQFFIKLSDGTNVWLNSETKLKFPVSFKEGESRQVELVYGEAYFEVSPSTLHQGSDFMVFHENQEIQVLGTEFNVKAYNDENSIYTTLVKGKVSINLESHKQILAPSQQSVVDKLNQSVTISLVDIYNETSWREGIFSFEDKSLKEIMKVLSRWYDIEVEFKTKNIENEEFIGVLGKNQKIEFILSSIKNFGIINDYEIQGKTLVLR